jgi:hypothetical protein
MEEMDGIVGVSHCFGQEVAQEVVDGAPSVQGALDVFFGLLQVDF